MNDRASGGPLEHSELVAQGDILKEKYEAGEEEGTEKGGGESEQQHPEPPRGQGGHSSSDPMLLRFSARLF